MNRFEEAKLVHDNLDAIVREKGLALRVLANAQPKTAMGLTPDYVKNTPAFVKAKREYTIAFAALRKYNQWYVKGFAKELRAERNEKRNIS